MLIARLVKPSLIKDTSRKGLKNLYMKPFRFFTNQQNIYKNVVLEKNLQDQLSTLSNSIINRK